MANSFTVTLYSVKQALVLKCNLKGEGKDHPIIDHEILRRVGERRFGRKVLESTMVDGRLASRLQSYHPVRTSVLS
jgi:hypothetical protein